MSTRRTLGLTGVFVAFTWIISAIAGAQPADYRTRFTFSRAVEVPGVTLPAGRYLFHVADPTFGSRVVQILSDDGRTAHAMFIAISAERIEASGKPELRFMETPAGTPPAIQTWWYPGRLIGWEFVYPKSQAVRLAQTATKPVLTTKEETTTPEETKEKPLARLAPAGEEDVVEGGSAPAPPAGSAYYGEVPPPDVAPQATVARAEPRRELPRTASLLPLVGLIGVVAAVAGALLEAWRGARA